MKWLSSIWLLTAGCSSTQRIATTASKIADTAAHGREAIGDAVEAYAINESPLPALEDADKDFQLIESLVNEVHKAVTQVQDIVPWWATLLMVTIAGASVLVCLWYLGEPLKRLFLLLLPVPSRKKASAKLLCEGQTEQAVAVLREGDPQFDRAFRKAKTAEKLNHK